MSEAFWTGEAFANGIEADSLRNTLNQYQNEIESSNNKIKNLTSKVYNLQSELDKQKVHEKNEIYTLAKAINDSPHNILWEYTKKWKEAEYLCSNIAIKCYFHERRNRDILDKTIAILKEKYNIPEAEIEGVIKNLYDEVRNEPLENIRLSAVGSPRFKDDLEQKQIVTLCDKLKILFEQRDKLRNEVNEIEASLAPAPAAPAAEKAAPTASTPTKDTAPNTAPAAQATKPKEEKSEEPKEGGLLSRFFGGAKR